MPSGDDLKKFLGAVVGGFIVENLLGREPKENYQDTVKTPHHQTTISPDGRLIVDFNGYRISSIYDTDSFKESLERFRDWISEPRLEIVARAEEDVQKLLKPSGPRAYGGLHPYSHVSGVVEQVLTMAIKAKVPPDSVMLIAALEHETGEDTEELRGYLRQWEDALTSGPNNSVDHQLRQSLETEINEVRLRTLKEREQRYKGYIPKNVRGNERHHLKRDIGKAFNIVFDVTRISNEVPYALSMGQVYTRHGNEDLVQLFRRMTIRDADGIRNMRETGPLLEQIVMSLIEQIFNENSAVGEALRARYGSVRAEPVYMPPAERVDTAANSIPALHYSNETFNRYAKEVKRNLGSRAERLFRLARLSRDGRSLAAEELLRSAINLYETFDEEAKAIRPQVEEDVRRRLQGTYFNRATIDDGSVKDWLLYDGGGRRFIELLDYFNEYRLRVYKSAKNLVELIPRFRMVHANDANADPSPLDNPNDFDPKRHSYFTLGGLDGIMRYMPDYWELVAGLKRDATRMRTEIAEMQRTGQLPQFIKSLRYT